MSRIKICGLSRPEDIAFVNEGRPDYCGFVIQVPASRRNVTLPTLYALRSRLSETICPVGVFVNAPVDVAAGLLNEGVIRIAQLHGQEDGAYLERLRSRTDAPIWKAFSITDRRDLLRARESQADRILLDHGPGGTGHSFDWRLLEDDLFPEEAGERSYILAGGLNAENLPQAIRRYRPWCVDISSSVETDGKKDKTKVLAAIAAVRSVTV